MAQDAESTMKNKNEEKLESVLNHFESTVSNNKRTNYYIFVENH